MAKRSVFFTALLAVMFFLFMDAQAQEPVKARPSPLEVVTMKWEDTYVKVTYSRPHKRNRTVFGELVPYGKVWRTGANEATELTTTGDIRLADQPVPAGTYSVFSIPQKDKWTIILNSELGQWGAYRYDESKDVLRFEVPASKLSDTYEPFTIEFEQTANEVLLKMMWDQTGVEIPVSFK